MRLKSAMGDVMTIQRRKSVVGSDFSIRSLGLPSSSEEEDDPADESEEDVDEARLSSTLEYPFGY